MCAWTWWRWGREGEEATTAGDDAGGRAGAKLRSLIMVHVHHGKTKIYLEMTRFYYLKYSSFLLNIRVCTRVIFNVASPLREGAEVTTAGLAAANRSGRSASTSSQNFYFILIFYNLIL